MNIFLTALDQIRQNRQDTLFATSLVIGVIILFIIFFLIIWEARRRKS